MTIGGKLAAGFSAQFPALNNNNHTINSLYSTSYNCIAYAANRTNKWWWPNPQGQDDFWPSGVPNNDSIEAFVLAYNTIGYTSCGLDSSLQNEFEKIAIYAICGAVKHAARQLPSGMWVSKLGKSVDIEHELDALDGPCYGTPAQFMKRHYLINALYCFS